jgi:hypothetical protein
VRTKAPLTAITLALALGSIAAVPASALCPPYLCYVDLASGQFICPQQQNPVVYSNFQVSPIVIGPNNPGCDAAFWKSFMVQVDLPQGCSGITVWVEYVGQPEGWTLDIGDSPTNNGFGGDSTSLPLGQNAEAQILDENMSVFSAADNPTDVDRLTLQQLSLLDGAIKFVVKDQFVSWGQPYGELATPDLQQLFFLGPNNANRTLYVGFNRVVAQDQSRNGCGARHAIIFTQ